MFFFSPHYSTTIADTGYGRGGSLLAHFILQSLAVTRASDPVPFAILGFCAVLIFQYESAMALEATLRQEKAESLFLREVQSHSCEWLKPRSDPPYRRLYLARLQGRLQRKMNYHS